MAAVKMIGAIGDRDFELRDDMNERAEVPDYRQRCCSSRPPAWRTAPDA
jgi:hypothetical protein